MKQDTPEDAFPQEAGSTDSRTEVRPPRLSLLILVLFPFLVVLLLSLLDGWIRGGRGL